MASTRCRQCGDVRISPNGGTLATCRRDGSHPTPEIVSDEVAVLAAELARAGVQPETFEELLRCVRSPRPPREAYVRASRQTVGGAFVEPGVEFRDGDSFRDLEHILYCILVDADQGRGEHDPQRIAAPVEIAIKQRWPDRAYFIEVHDPRINPDGGWLQIFQPFGVPRNR